MLHVGGASEPVQARDVFDVSSAMWYAWKASAGSSAAARNVAISYAAYRVLLWDASFYANLSRTFGHAGDAAALALLLAGLRK